MNKSLLPLLVSACLLTACGDNDNAASPAPGNSGPASPTDTEGNGTPTTANVWEHIRITYGPTEASEDYCPDFRIDVERNKSFWARGCGRDLRGTIGDQDMAALDGASRTMLDRLNASLECFSDGSADGPAHDFMIRVPGSGTSRTVYSRNANGQVCHRGDLASARAYADLVEPIVRRYASPSTGQ